MGCLSDFSFHKKCYPRMGGVRAIYVALRSDVADDWYIDGDTTLANDNITGRTFQRIAGRGSFQTVAQVNEDTGQVYYRDELNFTPSNSDDDANISSVLSQLSVSAPDELIVIVEPWSGKGWILGKCIVDMNLNLADAPVFFSGGQYVTGTEHTDANGLSFVLSSVHPFPALNAYLYVEAVDNPSTD